jgi:hypothetical protein
MNEFVMVCVQTELGPTACQGNSRNEHQKTMNGKQAQENRFQFGLTFCSLSLNGRSHIRELLA